MVTSETNKNVYVCDGIQTVFPITFDVAFDDYGNAEGVAVSLQDPVGTVTVLTKETHYTISGKNITTVATYEADYKIAIYRKNAILQQIGFVKNGKADLDVLEKLLDRIIFHIQEHEEKLGRMFLAPVTESLIENINEALQVLINGNPDAFLTTLGMTDYIKTLLDDETASAALSTLGFTAYAKSIIAAASAGDAQTVLGISTFVKGLLDDADAATARGTLSVYSQAEVNGGPAQDQVRTNQIGPKDASDDDLVQPTNGHLKINGTHSGIHQMLYVRDEKAAGTKAGTATSGAWRTRDLNTVVYNTITGASLSTNQITLPAGTYWVEAGAPAQGTRGHRSRLYDITNSEVLLLGSTEYHIWNSGNADTFVNIRSRIQGLIILTGETELELQHIFEVTQADEGLGDCWATGFSIVEIYSEVLIRKVA